MHFFKILSMIDSTNCCKNTAKINLQNKVTYSGFGGFLASKTKINIYSNPNQKYMKKRFSVAYFNT